MCGIRWVAQGRYAEGSRQDSIMWARSEPLAFLRSIDRVRPAEVPSGERNSGRGWGSKFARQVGAKDKRSPEGQLGNGREPYMLCRARRVYARWPSLLKKGTKKLRRHDGCQSLSQSLSP